MPAQKNCRTPDRTAQVKVTYYLEILSSWCVWAEPAWVALKARFPEQVEFGWRIALMRRQDFPASRAQCDWFYRRSGGTVMHSPEMLSSGWVEPARRGNYEAPNLVAEAGRDFGFDGDEIRVALANAAMREGRRIGDMAVAIAVASRASGLNAKKLRARAESPDVAARVKTDTAEFFSHRIDQRPAFILESSIGDKAVFSGFARMEPLAAAIDAMLADAAAYAAHAAHFGSTPAG